MRIVLSTCGEVSGVGVIVTSCAPRSSSGRPKRKAGDRNLRQAAIAPAGAVEPVIRAADVRAHEDVVEPAYHRQVSIHAVAEQGVHCDRIRLDVQRAKHREQQSRLGLAVAVAARPCVIDVRRHEAALVHAEEDVPHLVLHQLQRGLGTRHGILRRVANLRDLAVERRRLREGRGSGEVRCKQRTDVGPGAIAAELDQAAQLIARGRVARRAHALHVVGGVYPLATTVCGAALLRAFDRIGGLPAKLVAVVPQRAYPHPIERRVRNRRDDLLRVVLEHGISAADRIGHVEDVPDFRDLRAAWSR